MVQKEVADRITARPGSKGFGGLSVMSQIHARITDSVAVSAEAFFPRPKVRSTILKIELLPQPLVVGEDLRCVRALVRAAFGRRRKTLGNALTAGLSSHRGSIEAVLEATQIDPRRRGETLSPGEFVRLARSLRQRGLIPAGN
jgi:16S rRNA (adenine1518-N6/adenine1519-N6)-dimethyltransferase